MIKYGTGEGLCQSTREVMDMRLIEMLYGFLVCDGDWRFSFVKKEGTDAYELGNFAGPHETSPQKLWRAREEAKLAMLQAGHTIVV